MNSGELFPVHAPEYNLDHLITYDVEAADGDRLAPCPVYKEKIEQIARMKAELEVLEKDYGQRALKNKDAQRPTMRGFNIANAGYKKKVRLLQQQIEKAKAELKTMPRKVALKTYDPKCRLDPCLARDCTP